MFPQRRTWQLAFQDRVPQDVQYLFKCRIAAQWIERWLDPQPHDPGIIFCVGTAQQFKRTLPISEVKMNQGDQIW